MEIDFLEELERDISNFGSDEVWKRTIGGKEIWFSPPTLVGQEKVADTIANSSLGATLVIESKRQTLAHSIVGIGKHDLRPFRHGSAVFPSVSKDGKPVKVALERYIYEKMVRWGHEFIENAFDVYADLMETHKKENLAKIKFENLKTPMEELAEYMLRVAELRQQLGLRPLVEQGEDAESEQEEPTQDVKPAPPPKETKAFDPFEVSEPGEEEIFMPQAPPPGSAPQYVPKVAPRVPVHQVAPPLAPEDPSPKYQQEQEAAAELESAFVRAHQGPVAPPPSRPDVVESRAPSGPVQPPQIDRITVPRNPRFNPSR